MAFEAIARHQSVSRAAGELSITQAAASIRLKGLEEQLGFPLFLRTNGHFSLTAAGTRYLVTVHKVIADLSEAAERAMRPSHKVRLCVLTALAQKWLIPRFATLMQQARDIDIELKTFDDESGGDVTDGDLFIRHCSNVDNAAIKLMDDEFIAVGRPEIAGQIRSFDPTELQGVKWLHEAPARAHPALADPLIDWLGQIGLGLDDIGPRMEFGSASLLVDAALHGVGVGLVRRTLVADHLAQKELVQLFHHGVPGAEAVYLVFAPGLQHDPAVARVRDWVLEQATERRQLMMPKDVSRRTLRRA